MISFTLDALQNRTQSQYTETSFVEDDPMMTRLPRPEDLPDFRDPPLVETVLSLQFRQLQGFSLVHLGMLWHQFRDAFPLIEEHPPLPSAHESFGMPSPAQMEVTIERKPPLPRLWLVNESETELIQIQEDRFIHNWRKAGKVSTPYPRYERVRAKFRDEVEKFQLFLTEERIGQITLNQCEVTYVNHIEPCEVWQRHGQMEGVLRNWTARESAFLPEVEGGRVQQRFVIRGDSGSPLGRLHASLVPAWTAGGQSPILVLTLTARGSPIGDGIDGAFAFFDLAREWIVKGFTDLTTTNMHRVWGRNDA